MRISVLSFFLTVFIGCHGTYIGGLGSLGYGAPGLRYGVPVVGKTPYPYTLPAIGFNALPLGKSAYSYPLDFDPYGIFYGGGAPYGLLDPGYEGAFVNKGLFDGGLGYRYGPPVGLLGKYGYPLKK